MKTCSIEGRIFRAFSSFHHLATREREVLSSSTRLKPNTPLLEVTGVKAHDKKIHQAFLAQYR